MNRRGLFNEFEREYQGRTKPDMVDYVEWLEKKLAPDSQLESLQAYFQRLGVKCQLIQDKVYLGEVNYDKVVDVNNWTDRQILRVDGADFHFDMQGNFVCNEVAEGYMDVESEASNA